MPHAPASCFPLAACWPATSSRLVSWRRWLAALAAVVVGLAVTQPMTAATISSSHSLGVVVQSGYLPGVPVLVRVEIHGANGAIDRSIWDAEATLSTDQPGVVLSTNKATLRNGLGSALVAFTGGTNFNLIVSVDTLTTNRPLNSLATAPVTTVSGTLPTGTNFWSGVVRVTNDVTVPVGSTLIIQSNTLVLMDGVASGTTAPDLLISGTIQSLGTEDAPVTITCTDGALRWGQIRHNTASPSLYRYTSITRGGRASGEGHTGTAPVVRPNASTIVFENCNFTDHADVIRGSATYGTPGKVMYGINSDLTFRDCLLSRSRMGPEIQGTAVLMTNCWMIEMRGPDDSDGFYIHAQQTGQSCAFKYCVIAGGDDDGLDTLDSIVQVDDCIIRDWNNLLEDAKGISVFNGATHVRRSLVVDSTVGINAKWSGGSPTFVTINNCTIGGCPTNVMAGYKANAPGPFIDIRITNCVIWGGKAAHSDFAPTNFTIVFSDLTEAWPGTGNLSTDPLFVSATNHDFRLLPGSPCINTGDPATPLDQDGSRADMGWVPFDASQFAGPSVSISSPANGAILRGPTNLLVTATASSSTGAVVSVEFLVDGASVGTDTTEPFEAVWTNSAFGIFNLRAIATDNGGLMATSAPVSVNLVSNFLPSVVITSPTNNSMFIAPTNLQIEAVASDEDGAVARVEFYRDGLLLGEDAAAPFSLSWSNVLPGAYTLTAVAVDSVNARGTSAPVSVTLSTGGEPTTNTLIALGSTWRFRDDGSDQGTNWRSAGFNDSAWLAGPAPLGYCTDGACLTFYSFATVVSYGPNASAKYITTYFRKSFLVEDAARITALGCRLQRDDGAVIYLNGVEVFRTNMGVGAISNTTYAAGTGNFALEQAGLPAGALTNLVSGTNLLAVEIHQGSGNSSDIAMELELTAVVSPPSNLPPVVNLISPATDLTLASPADLALAATAADFDGSVSSVKFYANAVLLGTATTSPYSLDWTNVPAGAYALNAVATDNLGVSSTSVVVNVTVSTNVAPPVILSQTPTPGAVTNLTQVAVTFSKPVIGVDAADLLINGTPAGSVSGSGSDYTFLFMQPAYGTVTITWAGSHGIADVFTPPHAFNESEPTATWQYQLLDTVVPQMISATPLPGSVLESFTNLTVIFSEAVSGVDASDLHVNSSPAITISGSSAGPYTFGFAQPANGVVHVQWSASSGIQDLSGNPLAAAPWSYVLSTNTAGVVISEIMYHPESENTAEEYIELFNRGQASVDLSGWKLSRGVRFTIPTNTTIPAGGYLVIAASVSNFVAKYPGVSNVVGGWEGILSNSRNTIDLDNALGQRADSVPYADEGAWAVRRRGDPSPLTSSPYRGWKWLKEHDGHGKSLELVNPAMPNEFGQNWAASAVTNGTPGSENSVATNNIPPLVLDVRHFPVVPTSSQSVTVQARVIDELGSNVTVRLHFRNDAVTPPAFTVTNMFDDGLHSDGAANDGIFAASIPPRPQATVVEFYVSALDAAGLTRTWPAPVQETNGTSLGQACNALYQVDDTNYIGAQPLYRFIMTERERAELAAIQSGTYATWPNPPGTSQSDATYNGAFVGIDAAGIESRYTVGIKNRGHGTRNRKPNNFRINFNSDQPWKGVIALNVNGQYTHAQILGAAIAQRAGLAGADSRAIQLRVNTTNLALLDNYVRTYGSYAANEVLNSDWAENHFPDDGSGNIYRAIRDISPSDMNYRGTNYTNYSNTYFKTSNNSENDWSDLIGMLRIVGTNDLFTPAAARQVINVEQWMLHIAIMAIFANQETGLNSGYNDDYYMYRGVADPRFQLVYYDLDSILSEGGSPLATNSTIFGCQNANGAGPAFTRLMGVPEFLQIYYRTLDRLLKGPFAQPQFDSLVQQTLGGYEASTRISNITNWMNGRRAYILSQVTPNLIPITNLPIATLTGVPRAVTPLTTATITVGGADVVAYRYFLNSDAYGDETAAALPITLSGLAHGSTNTIHVIAKNSSGLWQDTNSPTVSRTWVVNTNLTGVRLNEILALNNAAVNHFGTRPDMIELFNEGPVDADISGLRLTDDASSPSKFTFPAGTTLAAGAYLVVIAGNTDGTPGLHTGFALSRGGESVILFDSAARGGALLDSVSFGIQAADLSIGRLGTGGDWVLTQPTFGAANTAQSLGRAANLRINEWLAYGLPPTSDDFIELFNLDTLPVALGGLYLTDQPFGAPTRHPIASLSFIAGRGFAELIADGATAAGADHLGFSLSADQGQIALNAADLSSIDSVVYGPQQLNASMGRCPDGAAKITTLAATTPGVANVCPVEPPAPVLVTLMGMTNTTWRYNQLGTNLGTAWKESAYDDSAWPQGRALLAYENNNVPLQSLTNTVLSLTNATGGTNITFYFRTRFNFPVGATPSSFVFTNAFDDGAVVYLNGNEIFRQNMPVGTITYTNRASANAEISAFTQNVFAGAGLAVLPGENVLAVEVHQSTQSPPADVVMGQALTAVIVTNSPGAAGVVINEVLANNSALADADGSTPDWIELYNPSAAPVDVADMSLTDSQTNPRRWVFPPNSIVPAQGWLAVRCDGDKPASETNTGFGLKATGDSLFLYNKPGEGGSERDRVVFGLQIADYSIGRVGDGSSNWSLTLPSIGVANIAAPLGTAAQLKVNEWMAAPSSGNDWFEIYNSGSLPVALGLLWLSDDLANYSKSQIPPLSFIGAFSTNGYQKFECDNTPRADHVSFSLRAAGEAVGIFATNGAMIDGVYFGPQQDGVSSGRLPDGAGAIVSFATTPTPGNANYLPLESVVINEVLAHSDPPLEDAIEIQNLGPEPVDISGWWLSDANDTPRKYQVPPGRILPPGGFAVFYENQFGLIDQADIPFALSSSKGDEVHLSVTDTNGALTGYRAVAKFGPSADGVSFGRYATSVEAEFTSMSARSFGVDSPISVDDFRTSAGATNPYPLISPVVISEVMYHPPDAGGADNTIDEFIQLENRTAQTVFLFDTNYPTNTWRLRDAVDLDFPTNLSLAPAGRLVIVSFDPVTNLAALAQFQARYGSNATLVGPYAGKLDNGDESVELYRPDAPQLLPGPDQGLVPYIRVDRVHYRDLSPWPTSADGSGDSLHRLSLSGYGNDPTNWFAAPPTPGPQGPMDSDGDGMTDEWELTYNLDPHNPADAGVDSDGDRLSNLDEFLSGTNPRDPQSALRVDSVENSGSAAQIRFLAIAGHSYSIQHRPTLDSGSWTNLIQLPSRATNWMATVPDPDAAIIPQRFYRIVTPAQP